MLWYPTEIEENQLDSWWGFCVYCVFNSFHPLYCSSDMYVSILVLSHWNLALSKLIKCILYEEYCSVIPEINQTYDCSYAPSDHSLCGLIFFSDRLIFTMHLKAITSNWCLSKKKKIWMHRLHDPCQLMWAFVYGAVNLTVFVAALHNCHFLNVNAFYVHNYPFWIFQ